MTSTDERITHEGRFDADPTAGEHDERQDRYGFEYCGWCYDHDPRAQFEGPPRQAWPCPWSYNLRALTLHQPWASLVAGGMKRIETRSWSTPYRGWLAIHAGAAIPAYLGLGRRGTVRLGDYEIEKDSPRGLLLRGGGLAWPYRMPLGAIVAVAELIDCVPILSLGEESAVRRVEVADNDTLWLSEPDIEDDNEELVEMGDTMEVTSELPYGDYSVAYRTPFGPGQRFAWVFGRVKRVPRAIPCAGHQQLWDVARAGAEVLTRVTDLVERPV